MHFTVALLALAGLATAAPSKIFAAPYSEYAEIVPGQGSSRYALRDGPLVILATSAELNLTAGVDNPAHRFEKNYAFFADCSRKCLQTDFDFMTVKGGVKSVLSHTTRCYVYADENCEHEMLDTSDVKGLQLYVTPGAKSVKCLFGC